MNNKIKKHRKVHLTTVVVTLFTSLVFLPFDVHAIPNTWSSGVSNTSSYNVSVDETNPLGSTTTNTNSITVEIQNSAEAHNFGSIIMDSGTNLNIKLGPIGSMVRNRAGSDFTNNGTITIEGDGDGDGDGTITNNSAIMNDSGSSFINNSIIINDGAITSAAGSFVNTTSGTVTNNGIMNNFFSNEGLLKGSGTITGTFTNNGILSPGNSLGVMNILAGDGYIEKGTLEIDLTSTTEGTGYDYVYVSDWPAPFPFPPFPGGDVEIDGATLKLLFTSTFNESTGLSNGDFFDIIQYTGAYNGGTFTAIEIYVDGILTPLSGSLEIDYEYIGVGEQSVRLTYATAPEPETYLLFGSFLLIAMYAKKKKRGPGLTEQAIFLNPRIPGLTLF